MDDVDDVDYNDLPDSVAPDQAWGYCDKMCHKRNLKPDLLQEVSTFVFWFSPIQTWKKLQACKCCLQTLFKKIVDIIG